MRPDPRYELALASQVPHTQTEHPDTSAVAVTHGVHGTGGNDERCTMASRERKLNVPLMLLHIL